MVSCDKITLLLSFESDFLDRYVSCSDAKRVKRDGGGISIESVREHEVAPRLVECGVESALENDKGLVRQHMRSSIFQAHLVLQRCGFAFALTETFEQIQENHATRMRLNLTSSSSASRCQTLGSGRWADEHST
jgi:hypothetical protein